VKAAAVRTMAGLNIFSRRLELGQYSVSFFSAGLLAVLITLIGVPVIMMVLMSLRTGFPGEGGPLTLQNFIDVYADAGTYDVLANTVLFSLGSVQWRCSLQCRSRGCSCAPTCPSKKLFMCSLP